MNDCVATFKLILVGDGGTGKSAFIKRHISGEFEKRYIATMGVDVHPLTFHTNRGNICFNCWDCAGQDKFGGLRDGYYIQGQCAMIFIDHSFDVSVKNMPNWFRDVVRVCDDIPIAIIGHKSDLVNDDNDANQAGGAPAARVRDRVESFMMRVLAGGVEASAGGAPTLRVSRIAYFSISSKTGADMEQPFLWMARQLANSSELEFVSTPALKSS